METIDTGNGKDRPKGIVAPGPFAYYLIVLFILFYLIRPNVWIPGPFFGSLIMITGVLAISLGVLGFFQGSVRISPLPRGVFFLVVLFGLLSLAIPFSMWQGGSLTLVLGEFSKVIVIIFLISATATSLPRLTFLLFVHGAVITVLAVSVAMGYNPAGADMERATSSTGLFGNSNDIALNIALIFPFGVLYFLKSRSLAIRAVLASALMLMSYVVMITYSRSGFLALAVAAAVCVWKFGLKDRRPVLVSFAVVVCLASFLLFNPVDYSGRLRSILDSELDTTGSSISRWNILTRSLEVILEHPLFGIGPGMFPSESGSWHGAHNTYTLMGAEAGLPALVCFALILWGALSDIRRSRRLGGQDAHFHLTASAVSASIAALVVGSFFSDLAYHYYPYFSVAYAGALYRIAHASATARRAELGEAHQEHSRTIPGRGGSEGVSDWGLSVR